MDSLPASTRWYGPWFASLLAGVFARWRLIPTKRAKRSKSSTLRISRMWCLQATLLQQMLHQRAIPQAMFHVRLPILVLPRCRPQTYPRTTFPRATHLQLADCPPCRVLLAVSREVSLPCLLQAWEPGIPDSLAFDKRISKKSWLKALSFRALQALHGLTAFARILYLCAPFRSESHSF
jgi:hypothetical protein